ncbi:MAG: NHL repeat-containing protein, partial [Verrucomicrobia bacterium]|nr:NHL repeat-containing protein [Verrucomicrobiota bacterium]
MPRSLDFASSLLYQKSITGPFGVGGSFQTPRGIIFDKAGFLYVADAGRNAVFVFDQQGLFVRLIGGVSGANPGQLNGVIDVAVAPNGNIYVLESSNLRISVFLPDGTFAKTIGSPGTLNSQFSAPRGIAISRSGKVYVCQSGDYNVAGVTKFDLDGNVITRWTWRDERVANSQHKIWLSPTGIRVDDSESLFTLMSVTNAIGTSQAYLNGIDWSNYIKMSDGEGNIYTTFSIPPSSQWGNATTWPTFGLTPEGSLIVANRGTSELRMYHRAKRNQFVPPNNSIPMPSVTATIQRPNSPFVDIDYEVWDADDATVQTGMLVFKTGTQSLANCIRDLTLVEGTETKLGTGIPANQKHRVTWNSGADWATPLADYRVAILAKDSRQKLLDIHYLDLPAAGGIGPLRISRSPLIESDYMQVWWWLLATHDTGIRLDPAGKIYGLGGSYDNVLLCDESVTPATKTEGRNYIFAKLGLREASTAEVAWAKSGSSAGTGTATVNVWSAGRQVGGRPKNVNEYG